MSWRTRSAWPSATKRSISSSMIGPMNSGSQRASAFSRKAWATRLRCLRCSGSSMPRIMWPITMPMVHVVAGRGEGLRVPQDPRAVVVAVSDPSRLDVEALGEGVGGHGEALAHRRLPALDREVGVRVAGGPGDDVVEGGERVVLLGVGCGHGEAPSPLGAMGDVGVRLRAAATACTATPRQRRRPGGLRRRLPAP